MIKIQMDKRESFEFADISQNPIMIHTHIQYFQIAAVRENMVPNAQ